MADNQWHLDKRVPIALIATLAAQLFYFGYLVSQIQSTLENHGARIVKLEADGDSMRTGLSEVSERLARVEEQGKAQLEMTRRIYEKVDK
jgi:hypothetical protein